MTYLAIARKWRPTTFDEIVGQRHVTRTLKNAIRLGRIHHAFLFTGSRGVGKTTAARALARALNCEHGPTPDPCGECTLCTAILAGSAPDVVEIDGASNNSVDDIRELREGVRYLPSQGRYRIYIIDEVHMLTKPAFNALLKTLEEPPPHVVFIFATTEPQKIPETILSRVQRFDFKRIPPAQVVERLRAIVSAEACEISDAGLRMIARAGEGSMRDAQSLLDQVISFGGAAVTDSQVAEILGLVDRSLLYRMLEGLVKGDPALCLDAIAAVHEYGFEMGEFTSELLEVVRNAALVALSKEARRHLDVSEDEVARLASLAEGLDAEVFTRWFDTLLEVHDRVARSARPRLVLEMAVARLAMVRPAPGLDRILARLEDLDRRLRGRAPPPAGPSGGGPDGGGPRGGPSFRDAGPRRPEPDRAPPSRAPGGAPRAMAAEAAPVAPVLPAPPVVEGLPLPYVRPDADGVHRYDAVLDVLAASDTTWLPLVDHSAFHGWDGTTLTVAFRSEIQLRHGREGLQSPRLKPILDMAFPGLRSISTLLVPADAGGHPTRTEARKASHEARVQALTEGVQADPRVRELVARLGLVLEGVEVPRDEEER